MKPIVIISSWPPRLCGIATFAEEAREFIQKHNPTRKVLVICHTDGSGDGVFPLIDMTRHGWWKPVVKKIKELDPSVVHIEHEYGLYEFYDEHGAGDTNAGFLALLKAIQDYPIVVEPHTVHGRLRDAEANFIFQLCKLADVVMFKCAYQKWRLHWTFDSFEWTMPRNIMIVPHGARPDRRWPVEKVPELRAELGLDRACCLGPHLVGLVGWIQANKRWDILISMWRDIAIEIKRCTGEEWDLLAAGAMRDPRDLSNYEKYKSEVELLEREGLAHYYEFVPRGDIYYKVMAVCDFIVLPSQDETQSGTLARIIALNKPYITTAPMEGLTSQTLESEGGLMFTTKKMLKEKVIRLACSEELRMKLGSNLRRYLDEVVSWDVVVKQYNKAYRLARKAKRTGKTPELPMEFE
ncbi:glycosyltransferase [Desulfohalobiaceae bacterium Ax17]|uniref:glycosyltransferase n=1 Tax=Desulfovulcanus ferrireducens TaxID=2831190 RepID=UPI00207BBFC2|nr:glycosyltransferase [Desulfovulcanus ferrireducens]MBT8763623.1 glycosyltransferase [Desulfovulcanus ferrireducens]